MPYLVAGRKPPSQPFFIPQPSTRLASNEWVSRLFDALLDIQRGRFLCECGGKSYLTLEFQFGNGSYLHPCRVLDVFLPKPMPRSWRERRLQRSFYPFLVIVESSDSGHQEAWLPYWHIDKNSRGDTVGVKYGQWASFLRASVLASLTSQARAKGYKV
jgi:hypothetical protein